MKRSVFEPGNTGIAEAVKPLGQRIPGAAWIFRLQIEEFLALLAFAPIVYYTSKAYFILRAQGYIPGMFIMDIQRVIGIIIAIAITHLIVRYRPQWKVLKIVLPFAYCLAIYTNLHDTIHFINPHDIHFTLIRIDQWLFGVQPSVWAQQFIRAWLTELFSFFYWVYFLVTPLVPIVLYLQKRNPESRKALISTFLCLYVGYILYIIFPAISPDIVLKDMYTIKFTSDPITDITMGIANSLPKDARDAFPSLHAGIALLSLLLAWKYVRWLFWILLPICIGLVASTIYLRHHYFIDLPAGFILGFLAFKWGGPIDAWWRAQNPKI